MYYKEMTSATLAELGEKNAELDRLVCVLEEMERSLGELRCSLEQFQHRYSCEVAQKQIELNRLNAQLEELRSRKLRHGSPVNIKSGGVEREADQRAEEKKGFIIDTGQVPHSLKDMKVAQQLYRKIASIIHPDKATDGRSRPFRTQLMAELNDAYDGKDMPAMQSIFEHWRESPEAVVGDGVSAELERAERAIVLRKRRVVEIEREISEIMASEMYAMMMKVQEADKAGKAGLAEMMRAIDAKIELVRNTLFMRMFG